MNRAPPQDRRRANRLAALLAAALLATTLSCGPGVSRAADAPAAPAATISDADRAQAKALADTLDDDAKRKALVAQLRTMAQALPAPAQPSAASGVVRQLTQAAQDAGDSILDAASEIADMGNVTNWVAGQAGDEHARTRVERVVIRLLVVFAGGLIVEWLLRRLLAQPRHYVESRQAPNRWLRAPLLAGRLVIDLVPIAGFAASAYALLALPFYRPGGHSELVSVAVIIAYALASAAGTLVEALFAPRQPALRALALDDADAARLAQWSRRLLLVGIWGYTADDVLRLLGLPESGFQSLLKLLGLALTIMLVAVVVEFRRPVSRWIRGTGMALARPPGIDRRVASLRNGLAEVWHVLAMLYVLAAFAIWALRVEGGFEFLLRATLFTAAILVVARLASGAIARALDRALETARDAPERSPQLLARRRRYRRLARTAIDLAIAILALLGVLEAWGADTLGWLGGDTGRRLLGAVATIVAVIVVAVLIWETVNGAIERYLARTDLDGTPVARSARARTLLPLMRNAFTVLLVLVVGLIVLSEVGVNVAPLVAGAGVLGVAVGFGSQKLVQDVITGAFILFEDTIAVGDTVTIGPHSGTVEGMTIRTMRLRSATGELHTLPFSSVVTVVNQSRGYANWAFSVGVSYDDDIDRVMQVMRDVGEEMRKDEVWGAEVIAPVEVFGLDKFTDLAVIVSGQIRTAPGRQDPVGREFYRRLKKRFDELGIVMPHTLYVGADGKPRATGG